ncbi:major facilitator superfamily domain-containing protein [Emericellopsis atlantica]|uniref:Major facilitator superfamily domain-containing protein n=1 Tax=Emericellopsis atlantica TaxID=2614577 RepID=A0A9P8CPQ0_9HYPO|nr:major facilitator superfamily domain-containing protein [Emericellopsis atlantica]KAG9252976.1 major facilitator superfamily domain-containing protein [Emericellopsis atlantica]
MANESISKAETGGSFVQETTEKDGAPVYEYDRLAERKLRNKIDLMIMPTTCLLYLFCFIDRANIGNARIAGMDVELGMKGFDYNATLSMFYVSYIVFELPSNVVCKLVGPGWFIPFLTVMFGICSIGCGFVQTTQQMMGVRFLLGIFEAGMMPGVAYYLSRWYRRSELTFRMGLYLVTGPVAGAFGALLAGAILNLDSFGAAKGWRMIFAIEGVVTISLGVIGFFTLTDRPETARWLSADEKRLCEERLRSERLGATKVLDKLDKKKLVLGMFNPMVITTSVIFLFCNITVQGLGFFLPTIVGSIHADKTVIQKQLFTVPPYIVGSIVTLIIPLLSWRWDRRQIFMIVTAPMGITGYIIFLATTNQTARYAATFLITSSAFYLGALTNSQVSANVVSDTARTSAIGLNVLFGNIGGLISTWSFLPFDAPNYPIGNGLNLGVQMGTLTIATIMLFWMKRNNAARDRRETEELDKIRDMTREEQEDLDWKHPSFRWRS